LRRKEVETKSGSIFTQPPALEVKEEEKGLAKKKEDGEKVTKRPNRRVATKCGGNQKQKGAKIKTGVSWKGGTNIKTWCKNHIHLKSNKLQR